MRPTPPRYPRPLQLIHWLLALGVLGQLALALVLTQLRSLSFGQAVLGLHQQVGLCVLALVCVRGVVGRMHRPPQPVEGLPPWQHRAAAALHVVLLGLLVAQPLLGMAASWGRGETLSIFGVASVGPPFEMSDAAYERTMQAHIVVASLLLAIVLLHLGAVAFNRIVRHVSVMERMLPAPSAGELRNRMPVGAQLALAFAAVLAIGVASGVYAISKYREVTRLEAAVQGADVAALDAAHAAQIAWKELKGLAAARTVDAAHIGELAIEARTQIEAAAEKTSDVDSRSALRKLVRDVTDVPSAGELREVDDALQGAVDQLAAALFQARTQYDDQAARGHDLIVVSLLPMILAALVVAVLLGRSIAGSLARAQRLIQAVGAGQVRSDILVVGQGEFSLLVRETIAMGEAVERRAADGAAQQRALESERLELLEQARRHEAAERERLAAEAAERMARERDERERQAETLRTLKEREAATRAETEARERVERERQRRTLAREFETQVAGLVEAAAGTVAELTTAADRMSRLARTSVQRSRQASGLATETHATASAIATGAGQLSDTASGVRAQAERSRAEALATVADAAEARTLIEGLIEAVHQISSITGMIGEVSRKSEMLGINARIEAARAGEAGRGFAVVATDVKDLAARTREANERIEKQIADVGRAAQAAAEFLRRIGSRVETLGTAATQILTAAESQCSSTDEIADRMTQVSRSTQAVATDVGEAETSVASTAELSAAVLDHANRMDERTRQMQARVSEFVLALQGVASSRDRGADRVILESVA